MARPLKSKEVIRHARIKRASALKAWSLNIPTVPRIAPAGPMSAAIKEVDAETRAMIDAALAKRGTP